MDTNTKSVPFGQPQEVVITPQEGYELECVTVINTANGQPVASELKKTLDNPVQYTCYFKQPAGHVSIKPKVKPILYSVIIEECDFCNVVLLDYNDAAKVEVVNTTTPPTAENAEDNSNFNNPQHSFKDDAAKAVDVEDIISTPDEAPVVETVNNSVDNQAASQPVTKPDKEKTEKTKPVKDVKQDSQPKNNKSSVKEQKATETSKSKPVENTTENEDDYVVKEDVPEPEETDGSETDVFYEADTSDELVEDEPQEITQEEYNKKCDIFWKWRNAQREGRVTKEEFAEVQKKHNKFLTNVKSGKIIIIEEK